MLTIKDLPELPTPESVWEERIKEAARCLASRVVSGVGKQAFSMHLEDLPLIKEWAESYGYKLCVIPSATYPDKACHVVIKPKEGSGLETQDET